MVQGKKLWNWELRDWVPHDVLTLTSFMTLVKSHCPWALISFWTAFSQSSKKSCNFSCIYLLHGRQVWCVYVSLVLLLLSVNARFLYQQETIRSMDVLFIFISLAPSTVPNSKRCSVNMCCVAGKGRPQGWLLWVHIFCLSSL